MSEVMGRLYAFAAGLLVGGAAVWCGIHYHVVRASDGVHFVPRATAGVDDVYVDIREFTLSDWDQHRGLAVALVRAEKGDLIQQSAGDNFRRAVDGLWRGLSGPTGGS